ncbi:MAG TPA: type 4a pilus biogenesis protein PilO [Candidatus Polarisedimenticolia bacterium]|jgi:type IV pilus assembly protein PilO|nr:type 4a pilus biogenesis protein PilO [Candidatus Polarisedimenticolia bacterium]
MDFKKLPFWGQFAVVAGMAAVLIGVAFTTYPNFNQMSHRNADERAKLEGLQTEIRKGQAIEAKLPEFEKEIENLQTKLNDLLAILPTTPETGELLKWVKNLTDQSNLELKQFNPQTLRPVEFYKEFPINMEIEGDYHDLGVFFDRISKYSRIINVSNVVIGARTQGSGKGSIHSTFTATTFVYDDKAAQAADASQSEGGTK